MQLAKSFIKHKDKHYYISTINRQSSSVLAYGHVYSETLAWEWLPDSERRGEQVAQDDGLENDIKSHIRIINFIINGGVD